MISPQPGRPSSFTRRPWHGAACLALAAGALLPAAARAQNIGTVRDNEFRSRWANYQVDRPQDTPSQNEVDNAAAANAAGVTTTSSEQAGLLGAFGRSFDDLLRNGPLQVRANFASGWEFSDEDSLRVQRPNGTDNSFFVAPAIGIFYNQELGPLTASARYSVGYVYYLDQNYLGADENGGILSQTAGLDLALDGKRANLVSHATGSYGNGNDIESGEERNLLDLGESLMGTYQLGEFTDVGASGTIDYARYTGGTVANTAAIDDSGSVYGDYVITGKTRLRAEFDAGQQLQESPGSNMASSDRYFYQAIISANYAPAPKLTFDAGLGYGFQGDSEVRGRGQSGSHPVYRITVSYLPTPKTTASFHFGYEGADVEPDFSLDARWEFRQNTSASLSLYQSSGYSTYEINQNLVTRGVLVTAQQKLFGRVDITLSGGAEQSSGYNNSNLNNNNSGFTPVSPQSNTQDPYYFGGVNFLYTINSYLALQGYYRGYTGEAGAIVNEKGLQSRAALSLRLTF